MILLHPVRKAFLPLPYSAIENQYYSKYKVLTPCILSYDTTYLLMAVANKAATQTSQISIWSTYPVRTFANIMLNFLTLFPPSDPVNLLLGINSKKKMGIIHTERALHTKISIKDLNSMKKWHRLNSLEGNESC